MNLSTLAEQLGELLTKRHISVVTAESCTGGWLGKTITSIPGASRWYDCGFITYSDESKQNLLGVPRETLEQYGAVSEQVATEMAFGALQRSSAMISVAITGIAGPSGGTADKPVGIVYLAWARKGEATAIVNKTEFQGTREEIRRQAVATAFRGLLQLLRG